MDSKTIALKSKLSHSEVLDIIEQDLDRFKSFGEVVYTLNKQEKIYLLNEEQTTFLVLLLPVNKYTSKFKENFIKELFAMGNLIDILED